MSVRTTLISATIAGVLFGAAFLNSRGGAREVVKPTAKIATEPTADEQAIAQANNQFAFDLYARLREADSGNLFFSPASISAALAMTYAGAAGQTEREMAEVLHFSLPSDRLHAGFASLLGRLGGDGSGDRAYELRIANRLWGQQGFRFLGPFLAVTREQYGAELAQVDFARATEAARLQINDWVAEHTEDKIQDLFPEGVLDGLTRLVLTNAIYFKGKWADPFKEEATKDAPFFLAADRQVDVPLMTQRETYRYAATDDLQILELPYEGDELSMLVLLPRQVDGLAALERQLTADTFAQWTGTLRRRPVQVFLPRFKLTSQFQLNDMLAAMGMPTAFDDRAANFSRMSDEDELHIQAVVHKAFVDVNEEGTEAAAATGVAAGVRSAPLRPETFRADHPFAFLIRDNATGGVLFLGRVTNPSE